MNAQYVLRLRRLRIGYECEFGCDYPDEECIGWTEGPPHWCLTRAGAMRWARRRERRQVRLHTPKVREEILL
jgi:hypothetical protein